MEVNKTLGGYFAPRKGETLFKKAIFDFWDAFISLQTDSLNSKLTLHSIVDLRLITKDRRQSKRVLDIHCDILNKKESKYKIAFEEISLILSFM